LPVGFSEIGYWFPVSLVGKSGRGIELVNVNAHFPKKDKFFVYANPVSRRKIKKFHSHRNFDKMKKSFFVRTPYQKRVFEKQMYWFPVPQDEADFTIIQWNLADVFCCL
jgi:hypothetical protein